MRVFPLTPSDATIRPSCFICPLEIGAAGIRVEALNVQTQSFLHRSGDRMTLAIISLLALIVAIVLSFTTRINVGFLCLVFAWIIGVYLGGLDVKAIRAGFPTDLFLTLVGVTLLFAQAQVNGTLERITHHGVK